MEENKKLNTAELEAPALQEEESSFDFRTIFTLLILNWQWFLVSIFICLCGAMLYLRYQAPVYQVSTKGGRPRMFSVISMEDISINAQGDVLYHDNKGYEDFFRKHHQ